MKRACIINTINSPYSILHSVPISSVKFTKGLLAERLNTVREVTIPTQYELLEQTQRINNFRRASGKVKGDYFGFFFNDTDVYKWIEAASYSLMTEKNPELEKLIDGVIEEIREAQDEDGYLDTYFTFERKKDRWTNLRDMHELYCAGHLIQAAIAHHRATGKRNLLDIAIKFADHIESVFGPGKKEGTPGHPEVEMALVELFRETRDYKYLSLAKFFIDERGKGLVGGDLYHIDHKPFRELDEIVGHAVRSLYLNCGASDLYLETGDKEILNALERLWHNFTERKMYITGGAGARYEGESFGEDYELPNETAYAETCASIASFMWNLRMLHILPEGRFGDIMELVLYNGLLSGISLDGEKYFYVNPLVDSGKHRRQKWFACACCPPNIARLIASLPGYVYSTSFDGVWIHLYTSNEAEIDWKERKLNISVDTEYPWDGKVNIKLNSAGKYAIYLRVPNWAEKYDVAINGEILNGIIENGYLKVEREWKAGDLITLNFDMKPKYIEANPNVKDDVGKIAVKRGPIVYCIEQADNPNLEMDNLEVDTLQPLETTYEPILKGVTIVKGKGKIAKNVWKKMLYLPKEVVDLERKEVEFKLVPYYAWANREAGPMKVWIRKI
ncbi:glycoside hydrolase family 127 protein [Dictyoglomus thermophilum]|uniref:glycoside hydrolase family 127 protein n=1 Tax=Dictyoglomus thermophilum TaxID=14 RepID=UPI0011EAA15B|nr:beta-L-arabinofuranosidase domain-containing protein [Dictyoglomus thermophilum]TYT24360.1 glycoside hydrolase family 127 protein [Dictyoglomus thermophilum]